MIVPFNAVFEYIQTITGGITIDAFVGYGNNKFSRAAFNYWKKGYEEKKRKDGQTEITIKSPSITLLGYVFETICRKEILNVSDANYKNIAISFINHFNDGKKLHRDYLDVNDYLHKIYNEKVPNDKDEFRAFLKTSTFWEFFKDYNRLWSNKNYREAEPPEIDVLKGDNVLVDFEDDLENHMPQYLSDIKSGKKELTVSWKQNVCDYSYFLIHPLVLVAGPGGQGKSLLLYVLRNINHTSKKIFDDVVIVPLIYLTALTFNETTVESDPLDRFIKIHYPNVDFSNSKKRYLLLIDGYNEYRVSKKVNVIEIITNTIEKLIKSIINKERKNISLVLTSREVDSTLEMLPDAGNKFKVLSLSGTTENVINSIRHQFRERNFPFDGTEIEQLIKTPLYALMIQELKDEKDLAQIQDKYALFDKVYLSRAKQRLGNEPRKNSYNKSYYLYFYYVLLPSFAYQLNTSSAYNDYYFQKTEIDKLFQFTTEGNLDKRIYRYYKEYFQKHSNDGLSAIEADSPTIDLSKIESFLQGEATDIIKQSSPENVATFHFEHQEWRDYLVSKYLRTNVELLHEHYNKPNCDDFLHDLKLNFNVDSNVAKLILQSFDMISTPEHNAKKTKEYFGLNGSISPHLYGVVKLMYTAFAFSEYLQLNLPEGHNKTNPELHKIIKKLTEYLLSVLWIEEFENKEKNNQELSNYQISRLKIRDNMLSIIKSDTDLSFCLCEVLSKESEFFRRDYNYHIDWKIIRIAKMINPNSDIILNQEAKIYLCSFEDRISTNNKERKITRCEQLEILSNDELLLKGMDLLKIVVKKGFHLSANLLGLLLTNPAPAIIKNAPSIKADFNGAFQNYLGVIYTAGFTKRDIAYTVRQALGLLLKGYIYVSDYNLFDPDEKSTRDVSLLSTKVCNPLFPQVLNEKSIKLAWHLVNKVDGQELAGLNYLRGCVAYALTNLNLAKLYWHSPMKNENDLLYSIARKYRLNEDGLDSKINNSFLENAKKIHGEGQLDRTHAVYWYIEAKEIELALVNGCAKEDRKRFFVELEKQYCNSEVLKNAYDFLNTK